MTSGRDQDTSWGRWLKGALLLAVVQGLLFGMVLGLSPLDADGDRSWGDVLAIGGVFAGCWLVITGAVEAWRRRG